LNALVQRDRRVIVTATAVSVALHVLAVLVTWNFSMFAAAAPPASTRLEEVELFLVPEEEEPAAETEGRRPQQYTAVPERLATEEPPEDPDFLALHNARAADRLAGGTDESQPGAEREFEVPQITVRQQDLEGGSGAVFSPQDQPEGRPQPDSGGGSAQEQEARAGETLDDAGLDPVAEAREERSAGDARADAEPGEGDRAPEAFEWMPGGTPSILKQGDRRDSGDRGFDFDQIESGTVGANIAVEGAFSLSTYEWDFAPWMHRFEQDLHRSWRAPYAYLLGVISGKTVIRLVVERDGRPSTMEVLETEGHESLHKASTSALQAFAPYAPLPPNFPDEELVIILTLHYPAWKR
jgi:outer membrane biosynthesis protein TonB